MDNIYYRDYEQQGLSTLTIFPLGSFTESLSPSSISPCIRSSTTSDIIANQQLFISISSEEVEVKEGGSEKI